MTTESNASLESMLDTQGSEPAPSAPVEVPATGETNSAATPADATGQAEARDDGPSVPRKALEDERKKRQALEARLADLERAGQPQQQQRQPQQQQQPPGITQEELERMWWENPAQAAAIVHQAAAQSASREAQRWMQSRELDRSEKRARKTHGEELVGKAIEEATRIGKIGEWVDDDDPYQSLVDWYNDTQALRDPQAAKEKLRAEILAELGHTPAAASKPNAQAPVPKSLASRTSAQPRGDNGQFATGRASLDDILG